MASPELDAAATAAAAVTNKEVLDEIKKTETKLDGLIQFVENQPPPPPPPHGISVKDMSVSTPKDRPVQITLEITDTDTSAVVTSTVTTPKHGTLTHIPQRTPNEPIYLYAPTALFTGTDSFNYSATDDKGNKSLAATVTIEVGVTPPPPPSGEKDEFGTPLMYARYPTPRASFALKPGTEARQFEEKAVRKPNGRYGFPNPTQGRIEFLPYDNAKPSDVSSYNLKTVLEQKDGILHVDPDQPNGDWPSDIEITWFYNMKRPGSGSHNGSAHTELVPGGFRQTNDSTIVGGVKSACQAMSIHANNYTDGRIKFEKDSEHTSGYTAHDPEKPGALGNIVGKDIGAKFVMYRAKNPNHDPAKSGAGKNSKYFMKLEQYHDLTGTGNSFKKTMEFTDDGTWGPTRGGNSDCCSGDKSYEYVVLWMTRMAIGIRCDNMVDFEFWNVTVTSIDSNRPLHSATGLLAPHTSVIEEVVSRD